MTDTFDFWQDFSREEFACHCGCGFAEVDPRLVRALQTLRDALRKPVRVTSGCRCPSYNRTVGGGTYSQHVLGMAADIQVAGVTARQLYAVARTIPEFHGFGVSDEGGYLHVDVREDSVRWCYRDSKMVKWFELPEEGVRRA